MRVYLIENKSNGKKYVGVTSRSLEHRWNEHVAKTNDQQNNQLVVRAIAKYGVDQFSMTQLEECESFEQMLNREVHWIAELKTFCNDPPHHGYNMTRGGEGTIGAVRSAEYRAKSSESHKRENLSPETLQRMSDGAKNRPPLSEEGCKKRSELMKGDNNPFFGKAWGRTGPLRDETKRRISEAHIGKVLSEEHKVNIGKASMGRVGVNLGRKFTDEELVKKRAAMSQKKKPCIVFSDNLPSYVCFSLEDAVVQSGVSYRKVERSVKRGDVIGSLRFVKCDQTIEELRSSNVTIGLLIEQVLEKRVIA